MKGDGWKLKMKYFQNVVDIVRDLMSPTGEEQQYKAGMQKDEDGFMDINWCGQKIIADWNDLRETFQVANARKAISPTQFNHQSTRGHWYEHLEHLNCAHAPIAGRFLLRCAYSSAGDCLL